MLALVIFNLEIRTQIFSFTGITEDTKSKNPLVNHSDRLVVNSLFYTLELVIFLCTQLCYQS